MTIKGPSALADGTGRVVSTRCGAGAGAWGSKFTVFLPKPFTHANSRYPLDRARRCLVVRVDVRLLEASSSRSNLEETWRLGGGGGQRKPFAPYGELSMKEMREVCAAEGLQIAGSADVLGARLAAWACGGPQALEALAIARKRRYKKPRLESATDNSDSDGGGSDEGAGGGGQRGEDGDGGSGHSDEEDAGRGHHGAGAGAGAEAGAGAGAGAGAHMHWKGGRVGGGASFVSGLPFPGPAALLLLPPHQLTLDLSASWVNSDAARRHVLLVTEARWLTSPAGGGASWDDPRVRGLLSEAALFEDPESSSYVPSADSRLANQLADRIVESLGTSLTSLAAAGGGGHQHELPTRAAIPSNAAPAAAEARVALRAEPRVGPFGLLGLGAAAGAASAPGFWGGAMDGGGASISGGGGGGGGAHARAAGADLLSISELGSKSFTAELGRPASDADAALQHPASVPASSAR